MKLIDQLRQQLEAVGATLDVGDTALYCDAPPGYVWAANDCACLPVTYANHSQTWLAKALREDAYPQLALGLNKVTDPAHLAQLQHDLGDDDWFAPEDAPNHIPWH
jgi:hypothetical protein